MFVMLCRLGGWSAGVDMHGLAVGVGLSSCGIRSWVGKVQVRPYKVKRVRKVWLGGHVPI